MLYEVITLPRFGFISTNQRCMSVERAGKHLQIAGPGYFDRSKLTDMIIDELRVVV